MLAFTLGPDFHVCLQLILKPELCGLVDAFSRLIPSEVLQGFRPVETCKYMNYLYVLFLSVRRCWVGGKLQVSGNEGMVWQENEF